MRREVVFAVMALTPKKWSRRVKSLFLQKNRFHVSIHARDRATRYGRAYASPVLGYPPEGRGFQPELVLMSKTILIKKPRSLPQKCTQGDFFT
jgi:hypothetical protein